MATASLPESRTKMIYEEQEGGIKTGWVTGDTFLALEINGNTVNPVTFTATAPASVKTTFTSSGATAASATTTWVAVLGKKASFDGGNVVCSYSGQNGSLKGLEGFDYMVASSTGEAPDFHFGNGKQLSYLLRIKMPEGVGKLEFNTAANGPEWTVRSDGSISGCTADYRPRAVKTLTLSRETSAGQTVCLAVPAIDYAGAGLIVTALSADGRRSEGKVLSADLSARGGKAGDFDLSGFPLLDRPLPSEAIDFVSKASGTLMGFCMLLSSFSRPVNQMILMTRSISATRASMMKVRDIEDAREDEIFQASADKAEDFPVLSGQIAADRLSFGYHRDAPPVVQNFSLRASPGSRIAIVGASGCGKSTVGKLLSGILHPWSGSVTLDGIRLEEIPHEFLTERMTVVEQSPALFAGTVQDNITLWQKQVRDEELMRALRDADAQRLVESLPGELNYELSEGGKNLSGGQRQKIHLARALYKNPAILILDEATSAIDAESEKRIMDNLRRRSCTCITVAHRLSTIRNSDLILVMDRGRIVQSGTHEMLMNQDGLYRKLLSQA